jgi:Galactose-3-O-sulfotransferase
MTIAEYIESGLAQEMNNSQTRALAGQVEMPYGENRPELLEVAQRNVEQHFSAVALTERFDESLVALARTFGWSKLSYVKAKVGGRREAVPPTTLELIDRMNELDRTLYAWAAGRLDAEIAADGGFDGRMARFRRRNMLYRPWATVTYTVPKKIQQRVAGTR